MPLGQGRGIAAAANWWDPDGDGLAVVAAYRSKGVANYAASKVNAANPGTYDITEGNGAVSWASGTGWAFVAASSKYLDTGVTPPIDQAFTVMCQFSMSVAIDGILCGVRDGAVAGNTMTVTPKWSDNNAYYAHGGIISASPGYLSGNMAIAGATAYYNGAAEVGVISGWGAVTLDSIYIGCRHKRFGNLPEFFITSDIYAVALYTAALTAPQVSSVATAMAAL